MNNIELRFDIATSKNTSDWGYGRCFLELLIETDTRLTPQIVDYKREFESIEGCEPLWGQRVTASGPMGKSEFLMPFNWKRSSSLRSSGRLGFADHNKSGVLPSGGVSILSDFDVKSKWLNLFKEACSLFEPIGGVLHLLTSPEIQPDPLTAGIYSPYYMPIQKNIFQTKKMPNIGWATFFGGPLREEIDPIKLREHGYYVEDLAGGYLILMSEKLTDLIDDFPAFSRRRVELKKLLRADLFQITKEPDLSFPA